MKTEDQPNEETTKEVSMGTQFSLNLQACIHDIFNKEGDRSSNLF